MFRVAIIPRKNKGISLAQEYKYYVFGHYPSSCLYLKTWSCLFFKTQRFGYWILSPSSGKTYLFEPNR
jgi:hypothetical protein